MDNIDYLVLAVYGSILMELIFFPVKSEVSTYRQLKNNSKDGFRNKLLLLFRNIISLFAWIFPLILISINKENSIFHYSSVSFLEYIGIAICFLGRILTLFATFQKRKNLNVLLSSGAFNYSRHPIAVGMILTLTGLNLIFINIFEILLSIYFIISMHSKILQEELLLQNQFKEYKEYCGKVRRYL